jgi:hypothetical protein
MRTRATRTIRPAISLVDDIALRELTRGEQRACRIIDFCAAPLRNEFTHGCFVFHNFNNTKLSSSLSSETPCEQLKSLAIECRRDLGK